MTDRTDIGAHDVQERFNVYYNDRVSGDTKKGYTRVLNAGQAVVLDETNGTYDSSTRGKIKFRISITDTLLLCVEWVTCFVQWKMSMLYSRDIWK